jgi:anaerobic sulfite reductase subunit C
MKWTTEAEEAIKKVPFFVRNKVRARVEQEALQSGHERVTLAEVKATQKRYLTGMQSEVKGYQLDACFGPSGCPNAIAPSRDLVARIEILLQQSDLIGFLQSKGIRELKFHHEFRVTVADCPNACSQPQIKDIGIISARRPGISGISCTACEACVESCREAAITLDNTPPAPVIDEKLCVACGHCIPVCPGGSLTALAEGYRIQLGGKLGRHPQLARELPGIYDPSTILEIIDASLDIYKTRSQKGERFGEILRPDDFQYLNERFAPEAL